MNRRILVGKLILLTAASVLAGAVTFSLAGCATSNVLELSGTIESTQLDCNAEVSGKVLKVEKAEGSPVGAGDVIVVLDSSLQQFTVKQQEAVVRLKQAKLDELKAGTRPEQLTQAEEAVKSAGLAVKNARTGVDTAQTGYDYWLEKYNTVKALYESNSASENDLTDAKYKLDTAKQQLEVTQKQLESLESQQQSALAQQKLLQKGSTYQTIQAAQADLDQSQFQLEQAQLLLSKYQVRAPSAGTLLINNVDIGDIVNTGTNVGTVSDLSDLWIKVYIQQKYLKNISLGQELDLVTQALGGKTVKGKITYISDQAEYTPKNVETDEAKENTVFKVKIKIQDAEAGLKPGMTANAIIPLGG